MNELATQAWQRLARSLSTPGLTALARGLRSDSPAIIQGDSGATGDGLFLFGDPVAYALAIGDGITDKPTLRVAWSQHLAQANGGWTLGPGEVPAWALLAWWDMQPRAAVFAELLERVETELARRALRPVGVSVC